MAEELDLITEALLNGQANRVKMLTQIAIENGIKPMTILEKGLLPGMQVISDKFKQNMIYISDVLIASRAMHAGLYVLKPILSAPQQALRGRVVIGTVAGDLHDIGKNLVVMMMRGAGLDVIDLGVDVLPEDFILAVEDYQPEIVAMSAMLTTTLPMMPETIRELERNGLRDQVKVIIGGGPATKDFAHVIKADGFAMDATEVVDLVEQVLAVGK
ncbi:corrinoid protein [Candidatus Formimonas warabiya]|uniref:cobalamin B12-binding domain-containing protein n=1 Tax=Formimonas warabiya TaxID=1761012 RepID=UPI003002660A